MLIFLPSLVPFSFLSENVFLRNLYVPLSLSFLFLRFLENKFYNIYLSYLHSISRSISTFHDKVLKKVGKKKNQEIPQINRAANCLLLWSTVLIYYFGLLFCPHLLSILLVYITILKNMQFRSILQSPFVL